MAKRVLMAEVSGGRAGTMETEVRLIVGVNVALGNRGITVEAVRQCANEFFSRDNRMSFTPPFLLGPVFFQTILPCSGGYHLEMGGMPLHDSVMRECLGRHSCMSSQFL